MSHGDTKRRPSQTKSKVMFSCVAHFTLGKPGDFNSLREVIFIIFLMLP